VDSLTPDWLQVAVAAFQAFISCGSLVVAGLVGFIAWQQAQAMKHQRVALERQSESMAAQVAAANEQNRIAREQVEASIEAVRAAYRPYITLLRIPLVRSTPDLTLDLGFLISCSGNGAALHLRGRVVLERVMRRAENPPDWTSVVRAPLFNALAVDTLGGLKINLDPESSESLERFDPAVKPYAVGAQLAHIGRDSGGIRSGVLLLEYQDLGLQWWTFEQPFDVGFDPEPAASGDNRYYTPTFDPAQGLIRLGRIPDTYPPGDAP
jgi:hypothetical protein